MLEVGPVILAGSLNFGKLTGHRAPGKAMLAYLGAFLAFLALGVQAEVEFKHHNNTEMAAVLQQVHNRWVKCLLCPGPKGLKDLQARLCWLTWGPYWPFRCPPGLPGGLLGLGGPARS
jgi:hypothetical protein